MIQKPRAAFGYVLMENTYEDGEVWKVLIGSDMKCTTFWVQGQFKNTTIPDFLPGQFLRPFEYIPGVFEHTSVGESKVFCFDQRLNNQRYVDLVPFILSAGERRVLPKDTKLFFCAGKLVVNDQTIDKPTQISVRSKDTVVIATTDCYGLFF